LGEKLTFANTTAIRQEIARVIPAYKGIEYLTKAGDSFQIGGPRLCAGSKLSTPDGKAHFKAVSVSRAVLAEGLFRVVTRRGKQFNSMVHEDVDASTNALRRSIFMNPDDARRLALSAGDRVRLYNDFGSYIGEVLLAPVTAGTLEVYWPEGNVLIDPHARSPLAKIPAYKEITAALDRDGAREPEPILNP